MATEYYQNDGFGVPAPREREPIDLCLSTIPREDNRQVTPSCRISIGAADRLVSGGTFREKIIGGLVSGGAFREKIIGGLVAGGAFREKIIGELVAGGAFREKIIGGLVADCRISSKDNRPDCAGYLIASGATTDLRRTAAPRDAKRGYRLRQSDIGESQRGITVSRIALPKVLRG